MRVAAEDPANASPSPAGLPSRHAAGDGKAQGRGSGQGAVRVVAPPQPSGPREPRAARAERQRRERELARVEKDIETRETRARTLEAQLVDPELYHDAARSQAIVSEYERVRAELESLWQRLGELG